MSGDGAEKGNFRSVGGGEKVVVVVDTNILKQNYPLSSKSFIAFCDYLECNHEKVKIPKIVLLEIQALFSRDIKEKQKKLKNAISDLNFLIKITRPECDMRINENYHSEELSIEYVDFISKALNIQPNDIVNWKPDYLDEVVDRATKRVRPMSDNGQEFRDCILWLTILDIAYDTEEKSLIFISNNSKQFGYDGKLFDDLRIEAENREVTIKYYCSIDDFLKSHSIENSDVTKEWIIQHISNKSLKEEIIHKLISENFYPIIKWLQNNHHYPTCFFSLDQIKIEYLHHFLYPQKDETKFLSVDYNLEISGIADFEEEDYPPDAIFINKQAFEFDFCEKLVPCRSRGTIIKRKNLSIKCKCKIYTTIKNETIDGLEISEIIIQNIQIFEIEDGN